MFISYIMYLMFAFLYLFKKLMYLSLLNLILKVGFKSAQKDSFKIFKERTDPFKTTCSL